MISYCTHSDCIADAVQDLRFIAKVVPDRSAEMLLAETKLTSTAQVRCRHVPRKGPVAAPFPGGKDA